MSKDFIERPRQNEKDGAIAYVQNLLKQAREDRRNEDVDKLENLVRLLNTKKYGLVWEEHTELVEEEMKTKIPVFVENGTKKIVGNPESEDFNFLLEGDNLHSLQLLKKTHTGKIDVIYIDPPYNTGAKNWKYNNNYIDSKDSYKHSKWISMMKSRLDCARHLLKDDGVLVCAIDENEVATLKLLLEEVFGNEFIVDIVTIIQNPRGIQGNNFSYTNEFALFVYKKNYKVIFEREVDENDIDWSPLRNWGSESLRTDAKNCFYGIKIKDEKIIGFEDVLDDDEHPTKNKYLEDGTIIVYPIDNSGIERKWRYARQTVESIWDILRATCKKNVWDIEIGKPYAPYKTVWFDKKYDANEYGTQIINSMVPHNDFDFPKSLWNVYECLYATTKEKENAVILDFFAGSGTTGHAVEMLNKLYGGNRRYILATNNAIGENYGTIRTAPNNTKDGIVGVVANNNAVIKNYGTIEIKGEGNTGILLANGGDNEGNDPVNLDGAEGVVRKRIEPTGKKINGVEIVAPGNGTATIKRNGKPVVPTLVDTIPARPNEITAGATTLDLRKTALAESPSLTRASSLGMYVDTSGRQFTNPIQGLEHLTNLKEVNLIFGIEATNYTDSKDIQVGENILSPYNNTISTLSRNGKTKFNLNSGSLTWIATGTQNPDDTFNAVYLSKIPYTAFAKDKNTYNFMDGLEQRYGVEGIGTREKELFNKLNNIGKGEPHLLAQAVDEMKGHQYSNVEQRVNATGNILEEEFDYLRSEWQNVSKDSNKIKIFGARGEYKTNTAGVINYKNYAYGVAYVHENEDIKLGKGIGWYTGIVHNRFMFKDIGRSKEEQLQARVGLFKSIPFDENNSLNWTISGDIFVGYNKMHRNYLVVNEIFNAKAKYHIYGIGVKNQLAKSIRLSEDFSLRPYAALDLEYGRVSKIKEKSGEIKLNVKANDYISVKPEVGTELAYRHYYGTKTFRTSIGVAYENELGRVGNAKNKARVANTNADWYNLRGEKEDRRGNVKFDLNVGLDNQMYGVTANIGYDTKGHNVRGGLGLRVIF